MKNITFYKYQGTGNDFIIIDNRDLSFPKTKENIFKLCHRRFGIGADGLMLYENDANSDFKMVYYNSDGEESTMCGNGGRCIVKYAYDRKFIGHKTMFSAIDGLHHAEIKENDIVKLQMIDVKTIKNINSDFELNTGSPHYVTFQKGISQYNIKDKGSKIRYSDLYQKHGINVNFVEEIDPETIFVRTYERGVEDETLSCGTGITAAALSFVQKNNIPTSPIRIESLGGQLKVYWTKNNDGYTDIWLEGKAVEVFQGKW